MFQKAKIYYNETFASLKIRNYRLYFTSQAISQCGSWMQIIAQSWLVLTLTHSGTALGLLVAAQFLPVLIFGPYGGLVVDRFPKIKLMYFTQTILGLLALILGILVFTQAIKLWMVYVLAIMFGLVSAVESPTRRTFISEIVESKFILNAVTLNSVQFNLARIIGPAIGGVLIATLGIGTCFILNALSFIPVLIAVSLMDKTKLLGSEPVPHAKGQLKAGLKYILATPPLKNTLIMMFIIGTFTYEFAVSLPLLAQNTFQGNAATFSNLMSAMGVGAVIGGLYVASRKKISQKILARASFLLGLSVLLVSISPSLPFAFFGMMLVGILSINLGSMSNTILQTESRPEMRGRVLALLTVAYTGSTPIGGPIVGYISEHLNPRWGIAIGGLAAIIAALICWFNSQNKNPKTNA